MRFIGSEQHAVTLLAEVHVALVVDPGRQALLPLDDLRDVLGDEVVVFHGLDRQVDAGHPSHLARPQPGCIDHVFGVNCSRLRHHVPRAVGALAGLHNRGVRAKVRAKDACRPRVGMGHAGRVNVAIQRIPQGSNVAGRIDQRMAPGRFLDTDELLVQTHVPRLGPFPLEIVVPGVVGGEIEASGVVKPHGLTRQLLEFGVEIDRVSLESRDVGIRGNGVNLTRGVPGRSRCEFASLQKQGLLPPVPGKVEKDGATDHPAADDDNPDMVLHVNLPSWVVQKRRSGRHEDQDRNSSSVRWHSIRCPPSRCRTGGVSRSQVPAMARGQRE